MKSNAQKTFLQETGLWKVGIELSYIYSILVRQRISVGEKVDVGHFSLSCSFSTNFPGSLLNKSFVID